MKKVIYYNSTLLKGGTNKYMVELIKSVDKSKFSFDVIIKDGDEVDEFMLNELTELGTNVYCAKGRFKDKILYLKNFFKNHKNEYDIAHINSTGQATGLISFLAKIYGKIKKVIFHSHMGGMDRKKSLIDKFGAFLMFKYSDVLASCSTEASKFMFGENFKNKHEVKVLNNSVDINKFTFNETTRKRVRDELKIKSDSFVIIHVGRFIRLKNQKFLIEVFNEIKKKKSNTMLLFIGDGELLNDCKKQVEELNLTSSVQFLGLKNNVYDYMQAADCFVMPSFYEGLPIVAVEAQASGLPCVLSDNISKETKIADKVDFMSLDASPKEWANAILNYINLERKSGQRFMEQHKFDHKSATLEIEKLYEA